jgi:hypothetical protein
MKKYELRCLECDKLLAIQEVNLMVPGASLKKLLCGTATSLPSACEMAFNRRIIHPPTRDELVAAMAHRLAGKPLTAEAFLELYGLLKG